MDIPRGPAAALPLPLRNSSFRHNSRRSSPPPPIPASLAVDQDRFGMPIPGAGREHVPPALPPPRYVNDYGCDLAWTLQNRLHTHQQDSTDGFTKPGSSLRGGYAPNGLDQDQGNPMDVDIRWDRRDSAVTTVHHSARSASTPKLSLPPSSSSSMDPSSSAINPEFHGERPLAQQNHSQAIHAYDKEVLRKIGKAPPLLPLSTKTNSYDNSQFQRHVSLNSKSRSPVRSILTDSVFTQDRSSQALRSPNSITSTSPNSRVIRSDHHTAPRSPSYDLSSISARTDQEASWHRQLAMSDHQQSGSVAQGADDVASLQHRGSYDSSTGVPDTDSVPDNTGTHTQQIRDRPHREPFPGMKRRALSRPADLVTEQEPDSISSVQSYGRYGLTESSRQPKFGSVSSTASSVRHNSYTSSVLSAAPSSLTSISSFDIRSPSDLPTSLPYMASVKPTSSPSATSAPLRSLDDEPVADRTTSFQPPSISRQPLPTRIGNSFICSCCLKKPKKFATEEQLRAHESEKQYMCAYCPHRFKNKNEAERHQNSLHLRKHSWSCAAIRTPQDAFHPSNLSSPRASVTDTCGFCGEEFSNQPVSLSERIDHLTNIHKFAECNSTKKFFRADHFRQHLKHSHGGRSGKWTNMLENACLREEYGPESASLSPAGSEHSQGTVNSRSLPAGTMPAERHPDGDRSFDDGRYAR